MRDFIYKWAKANQSIYVGGSFKEQVARWLIVYVFPLRYAYERTLDNLADAEREMKRYRKKLDNLYAIIAEYEAVGEAATEVLENPQIDEILAREAVAYGD